MGHNWPSLPDFPEYIGKLLPKWQPPQPEPRPVELDRVDAHGRSIALSMSDRIREDISNGVYDCPICHENFEPDIAEIWACQSCFHGYHPNCIENWARTRSHLPSIIPWLCPTCKASHATYPKAGCWCTKHDMLTSVLTAGSCSQSCSKENRCGNRQDCKTYTCSAICHPGPCQQEECTDECGEEIPPLAPPPLAANGISSHVRPVTSSASINTAASDFNTYSPPPNDTYVTIDRRGRARVVNVNAPPVRSIFGFVKPTDTPSELNSDLVFLIPGFLFLNGILVIYHQTRIRRYVHPLLHPNFTEGNFRDWEQLLCMGGAALIFVVNVICFGSIILRLSHLLRLKLRLGVLPGAAVPRVTQKGIRHVVSNIVFFLLFLMFILFAAGVPAALIWGPGVAWRENMDGTCSGFDTRIKLNDPTAGYFGLQNKTINQGQYVFPTHFTQTPGRYVYPSADDYESYRSGIDLFNITRVNASDTSWWSQHQPFNSYWRIMGIYDGKPLHMDFDLIHRSWRMSEGSIVIDSENPRSSFYKGHLAKKLQQSHFHEPNMTKHLTPLFETTIQNLTEVRNGTWRATSDESQHTEFSELGLVIPRWHKFDRHCAYQSFMQVYRAGVGAGGRRKDGYWRYWTRKSSREEVMRTMSYGYGGRSGLEVCARRNDYLWDNNGMKEKESGLGEDLLVPLGLMAVVRQSMKDERGMLEQGCKWPEY